MKDKNINHILLINDSVLDYINKHGLNKNIFMSDDITLKALIDRVIYHYKKGNANIESIFFNVVKDLINNKIK